MLMDVSTLHFVNVGFDLLLCFFLLLSSRASTGAHGHPRQPMLEDCLQRGGQLHTCLWQLHHCPGPVWLACSQQVNTGSAWQLTAPGGTVNHWEMGIVDKCRSFLTPSRDSSEVSSTSSPRGPPWGWAPCSLTRLPFSLPCLTSHFLIILPEVVSQINYLYQGVAVAICRPRILSFAQLRLPIF